MSLFCRHLKDQTIFFYLWQCPKGVSRESGGRKNRWIRTPKGVLYAGRWGHSSLCAKTFIGGGLSGGRSAEASFFSVQVVGAVAVSNDGAAAQLELPPVQREQRGKGVGRLLDAQSVDNAFGRGTFYLVSLWNLDLILAGVLRRVKKHLYYKRFFWRETRPLSRRSTRRGGWWQLRGRRRRSDIQSNNLHLTDGWGKWRTFPELNNSMMSK